jgi:hypothetical protein
VDVLIFYTDGEAPQFKAANVRYELTSKEAILKRFRDACEYATDREFDCLKPSLLVVDDLSHYSSAFLR